MSRELLIVAPRVARFGSEAAVPLQHAVEETYRRAGRGVIALVGGPGSGKSTAIQFLAREMGRIPNIRFFDEPMRLRVKLAATTDVVVYTRSERYADLEHLAVLRLKPWDQDDLIEFVLAAHKTDCAPLMERIKQLPDAEKIAGQPELWRLIIAALAADEHARNARELLRLHMKASAPSERRRRRLALACLRRLLFSERTNVSIDLPADRAARERPMTPQLAWLKLSRHPWVRRILAAEALIDAVGRGRGHEYLWFRLDAELIEEAGHLAALDGGLRRHLAGIVGGEDESTQAGAASILNASGAGWMPERGSSPVLDGAYLPRANWPAAVLRNLQCRKALLTRANLNEARIEHANLDDSNLTGAWLSGADLHEANARGVNFSAARMAGLIAYKSDFNGANFTSADLEDARLDGASLVGAVLTRANLQRADLRNARLLATDLEETDLRGARLEGAELLELKLNTAQLLGAVFVGARLSECNLEGVTIPMANFARARLDRVYLTNSFLPHVIFKDAWLTECGLAGIDWEGADLRNAVLTGSTFHMGSSRNGLVGSTLASEGSRTGFYTDDFEDLKHKPPEEIRKANLRGADLRGAQIDDVDFYLVDLRDALLDEEQERHVRKCGAILETRGA